MKVWIKNATILAALLLCTQAAHASDTSSEAYCEYDKQKSEAERLLNQSPSLAVGFGRSNTATGDVLAIGITESLSKYLQGNLSHKIGDSDCRLYQITNEIQKHIQFDLQDLQLHQEQRQLDLTNTGIRSLELLIESEKQHLEVGASTMQNVATLEAAKQSLIVSKAQLEQQIALIVLPPVSEQRLDLLLQLANVYMLEEQQIIAKQSKLQNWDFAVTVGKGTNPNLPLFHTLPSTTFATASFVWSFGAPARSHALENAAQSYTTAVTTNTTGPITLAKLLQQQAMRARDAARASSEAFQTYDSTIQNQLTTITNIDSAVARSFRIQLNVSRINNNIELESNLYAQSLMDKYLGRNFSELKVLSLDPN